MDREPRKALGDLFKSISKIVNNLKPNCRLKKQLKPCFYLGLLLIIIFSIVFNQGGSSEIKSISLPQETALQDSSRSTLCQGEEIKEYPDLFFIQDNSLAAVTTASAVNSRVLAAFSSGSTGSAGNDIDEIDEYVVQEGESLSSIAKKFAISLETLLWANDLSTRSVIQPGQKLVILPTTGVMHLVRDGDTISQIAQTYTGDKEEIIAFNHLPTNGDIYVGDIIIIPDGTMPVVKPVAPQVPLASSYFILPLAGSKITQGLHWYNAIDFATGRCGDPIFAAAGAIVQKVGYTTIYGYYVQILHPNSVSTLYAHLSKIIVDSGQKVYQGQVIGYSGYTGRTFPASPTGCHLHFEVRGARNPFAR